MIHLDTHVVVWLYEGRTELLPPEVRRLLDGHRSLVSPMVRLELTFLHEIGRIRLGAGEILEALRAEIDLGPAETGWERVTSIASRLTWTRDPFDRLIAAHAIADDLPLLTRDARMLTHCPVARWIHAPAAR